MKFIAGFLVLAALGYCEAGCADHVEARVRRYNNFWAAKQKAYDDSIADAIRKQRGAVRNQRRPR